MICALLTGGTLFMAVLLWISRGHPARYMKWWVSEVRRSHRAGMLQAKQSRQALRDLYRKP